VLASAGGVECHTARATSRLDLPSSPSPICTRTPFLPVLSSRISSNSSMAVLHMQILRQRQQKSFGSQARFTIRIIETAQARVSFQSHLNITHISHRATCMSAVHLYILELITAFPLVPYCDGKTGFLTISPINARATSAAANTVVSPIVS
jgi:hypothetical protein